MKRFLAKLAFIHRYIWERDALYCLSLFVGPSALLGAAAAALAWMSVTAIGFTASSSQQPPTEWAKRALDATMWPPGDSQPNTAKPYALLPELDASGSPAESSFRPGWTVQIRSIEMVSGHFWTIGPKAISGFINQGASIDIYRIKSSAPPASESIGMGTTLLIVRTAGLYSLAVKTERFTATPADCLSSLHFADKKITVARDNGLFTDFARTYPAAHFDLKPGLYFMAWEFGCWRDKQLTGPGTLTVLMARPGETELSPIRAEDVVFPTGNRAAPGLRQ